MRKHLLLVLLLLLFSSIYSQDTIPKKYYRHCSGVNIVGSEFGLGVSPFFAFNGYQNKIGFGPVIGKVRRIHYSSGLFIAVGMSLPQYEDFSYSDDISLIGLTAFYDYLPKHISKPGYRVSKSDDPNFNIILSTRLTIMRDEFYWGGKNNIISVIPLVGLGFRIKILKVIVISQRFEVGYFYRSGNKSLYNNEGQSYKNNGGIFTMKLGVEANFNKK